MYGALDKPLHGQRIGDNLVQCLTDSLRRGAAVGSLTPEYRPHRERNTFPTVVGNQLAWLTVCAIMPCKLYLVHGLLM